jgi:hypothetical protein
MDNKCETLALHFKYCALIAVMLLIAIATERWSSNKDFTTYLSNAATMTSLLLGVVAIFYSFISNDGMSRSLGSINTVSSEIRDVRADIQRFVDQTRDSTRAAEVNNEIVRGSSSALSSTMESLNETLRAISSQNETLKGLVGELPTRIDQLEVRFGDVAKAIGEKPASTAAIADADISAKAVDAFLSRATYFENLFTIACVISASTKKPLDVPAFCKAVDWNAPVTLVGFLRCMHATALCNRTSLEGKDKTFNVTSIHPHLTQRAQKYFAEYVQRTFHDKPEDRAKWAGKLAAVEALFVSGATGA